MAVRQTTTLHSLRYNENWLRKMWCCVGARRNNSIHTNQPTLRLKQGGTQAHTVNQYAVSTYNQEGERM